MEKHITLVGVLHIVYSSLGLVTAIVLFVIITGAGVVSGDDTALMVTGIVGIVVFLFLLLVSIPGLIGGIGLLKRWPWSRILMIVVGALNLLSVPFGTALGIYTLWVLMHPDAIALMNHTTPATPTVLPGSGS